MPTVFGFLPRIGRSLALIMVSVLSTLGAQSLTHVGPVQAQSPSVNLAAIVARLNADETKISILQADNVALKTKTAPLSVFSTDLTITGVNVHIVSGSGSTSDDTIGFLGKPPARKALTGLGNLIIGYNEKGNLRGDTRTGSHNLILGDQNSYSSYGGFVAGFENTISGHYASVSGGQGNMASGHWASISGGCGNKASGADASVSGGNGNTASGLNASVSGGSDNTASGLIASVSGGSGISMEADYGWAAGDQGFNSLRNNSCRGSFRSP